MPKKPVPASGATRKRKASNIIPFPKKRGPKGPVDPFTALARRMANPNHAAAFLARLLAEAYGEKLDDAVAMALVLLTPPAQWPVHEWPEPVAWFHDWRLKVGGPLRSAPTGSTVRNILRKGCSPGTTRRAGIR
jgi:hypothetical protein